jgi:4-methylaminobutanoate oxidase (formaldehyde-forming)
MLLNGPESFTPDGSFLLGETAETRGLFLGCGMNSVGVATGGGAGMALAHAIVHGAPPADLHEADPKRFASSFNSVDALVARVPEVLGKHYEITYPARQWASARSLRPTPLHERWLQAKAHFGQVYDWERPLFFNKTSEPKPTFGKPDWFEAVGHEVAQAHGKAAIFDQSTFGKIDVSGKDAERFLNTVCANQMDRSPGRAIYTAMLNRRGGIESDLTALRLTEDHYRLYVGTTAIRRDLSWLRRHVDGFGVTIADVTADYAVIALMGPDSETIARNVGADELNELGYFRVGRATITGCSVTGARLSYVGERGWELTCAARDAGRIYDALHKQGARPAGAFAQTSMRIEKRFLAYGHDLDTDVTPIDAGLDFAVAWDTDFIGRDALSKRRDEGGENRLVSILLEDREAVPLGNEPVYFDGQIAGKTTSAAFGYRVGRPVALADLKLSAARADGALVDIDIAGTRCAGRVSESAIFDPGGRRMRIDSLGQPGGATA